MQASTARANYDSRTLMASGTNELYRNVDSFQPTVTFLPWRGAEREELTVEVGVRLQRFALLSPEANRNVASHALVNTLRYRRVRGDVATGRFTLTGLVGLTNGFGGDYSFDRQEVRGGAEYHLGASRLTVDFTGGSLRGDAPFTERFAAGNQLFLRGWNKLRLPRWGGGGWPRRAWSMGTRSRGSWRLRRLWIRARFGIRAGRRLRGIRRGPGCGRGMGSTSMSPFRCGMGGWSRCS